MKEKIIGLIACLSLSIGTLSAKSLVLTLENGTLVYYLLGKDANPMMRFTDGRITVNTDIYEFSGIKNFYISTADDPNGIEHTIKNTLAEYRNNMVIFNTDNMPVIKVYSGNGHEVNVSHRQIGDKTAIDLSTLPQGTYIITAGETSLKILKK
jgi:hypothetical protein